MPSKEKNSSNYYCCHVQEIKNPPPAASEGIKPPRGAVKSVGALKANTRSLQSKTLIFAREMKSRRASRKLVNAPLLPSDALSAHRGLEQLESNLHTIASTAPDDFLINELFWGIRPDATSVAPWGGNSFCQTHPPSPCPPTATTTL